jgi:citrate synthase
MISDPEQKISRPCHLYTGQIQRDYVPVDQP